MIVLIRDFSPSKPEVNAEKHLKINVLSTVFN